MYSRTVITCVAFCIWMVGCSKGQSCKDSHPKCQTWASAGECTKNPIYMLPNCAVSCSNCRGCRDLQSNCQRRATVGACRMTSPLAIGAIGKCLFSCNPCIWNKLPQKYASSKGCMKMYPDTNAYGANSVDCSRTTGVSCPWTSAKCRDYCSQTSQCKAVDWDSTSLSCWEHTQQRAMLQAKDVAHYLKNGICGGCGTPPTVQNANHNGEGKTENDGKVKYTCTAGYTFSGGKQEKEITCRSNTWERIEAMCNIVLCGPPKAVRNVVKNFNSVVDRDAYGSIFWYSCKPGYQGVGERAITCQLNGKWKGYFYCKAQHGCELPPKIPNVSKQFDPRTDSNAIGATFRYMCASGHKHGGTDKSITCQRNKTWTGKVNCKPIHCGSPPTVQNAVKQFNPANDNTTFGSTFRYTCKKHTVHVGDEVITCQANKIWSGRVKCQALVCFEPPNVDYSVNDAADTTVIGQTVTYGCLMGMEFKDGNRRKSLQCQKYGIWPRIDKACSHIRCQSPTEVKHAKIVNPAAHYNYLSKVNYICGKGHRHIQDRYIRCTINKKWEGSIKCVASNGCGTPRIVPNAIKQFNPKMDKSTVGSAFTYTCRKGYKQISDVTITCASSLYWKGNVKCKAVSCGIPSHPANAANHFNPTKDKDIYKSVFSYTCKEGHQFEKDSLITCGMDGKWRGHVACSAVDCGKPRDYANASKQVTRTTYGAKVYYTCADGSKTLVKTCNKSKQWEPSVGIKCKELSTDLPETGAMDLGDL